jgi:membrane associated rhomboid family serine protease/cytochrome c-type biogenesis protein CcmH/NrfG
MAKCVQCGRNMPAFSFKKKCAWCEQYEAAQRGEEVSDMQPVMRAPWQQSVASTAPVTTALLALNVLVFVLMAASGSSLSDPGGQDLIRWGSNFGPLTLGGQYWRLISYMFVHIGFFHLFMNMWFLYSLGTACERLLGSISYAAMYLISGVAGGIASLAWHPMTNSAGASGALFGILGAMIAAYQFGEFSMPRAYIQASLKSMLLCAGINLVWGLTGGIDNAAHIGGMVAGFIFGFLVVKVAPDASDFGRRFLVVLVVGSLVAGGFAFARNARLGPRGSAQRIAQLMQSGRTNDAISELRLAVAKNPNDPRIRLLLASVYSRAGQNAEALEQFQWIVAHSKAGDSLRESSISAIAWLYGQQKEYAKGEQYFQDLMKDSPSDTQARFAFAQMLSLEGKHNDAIVEFQKLASANPNDPAAYAELARNYSKIDKYDDAITAYKKAIDLENDPDESDGLKGELAALEKTKSSGVTK